MKNLQPRTLLVLLVFLLVGSLGAEAQPVISVPDPDAFFDVQPADCPTCTAAELSELGQGLRLLLDRLRQGTANPDGRLCGAEAGLAREMVVLTYDLVRQGAVSAPRWRDYVRARGTIAGLSETTREEMLLAYLERVAEQAGAEVAPESMAGRQIRIHGAAQLSRIFFLAATGEWGSQEWMNALASTEGGFNSVVDAVLSVTGPARTLLDQALVDSRPQLAWIDGQVAHLSHLPDDFQVGSIPTQRDALRDAYQAEMESRQFGTFYFLEGGCGWELVYAWREEAVRRTEGLIVDPHKHQEINPDEPESATAFEDEITVIGEDPGRNIPGDINPLPGSNGQPGPGTSGTPPQDRPFCDNDINDRIFDGECLRNLDCRLNPSIQQENFRNCQEEQPEFDEGPDNCIFRPPGSPQHCTADLDPFCSATTITCAVACSRVPLARRAGCHRACSQWDRFCRSLPEEREGW